MLISDLDLLLKQVDFVLLLQKLLLLPRDLWRNREHWQHSETRGREDQPSAHHSWICHQLKDGNTTLQRAGFATSWRMETPCFHGLNCQPVTLNEDQESPPVSVTTYTPLKPKQCLIPLRHGRVSIIILHCDVSTILSIILERKRFVKKKGCWEQNSE